MKIVFSTKNVNRSSFLDVCRYAYDYGFEGFEIYDAINERSFHHDSILRRERTADAKRKLLNRGISVPALRMPNLVESDEVTSDLVLKYVDMAANSGISYVILRMEEKISFEKFSPTKSTPKCNIIYVSLHFYCVNLNIKFALFTT